MAFGVFPIVGTNGLMSVDLGLRGAVVALCLLIIAMDTGFQSIGPFNRAFKAATNLTPTEFRRLAMTGNAAPVNDRLKIGQSS
jgi:hypothetical protein